MERLVTRAREARCAAYAPYSGYAVGAAVLTQDGSVYTGCNVEVANYTNTVHAEEMAVSEAIREGHRSFEAVVVSSADGATPCGMCRQTLAEFCGGDTTVIVDSVGDDEEREHSLSELYPHRFVGGDSSPGGGK